MDFESDEDLMKLIHQMAEEAGVALTDVQLKDLLEYSKQNFTVTISEEVKHGISSDSCHFLDSGELTNFVPPATKVIPSDLQNNVAEVIHLNLPTLGDSVESNGSIVNRPCAQCKPFLKGYPIPDSWEHWEPRLLRRMRMQNPHLPNYVLREIRNPCVLWCIMRKYALQSSEEVQNSLRNKLGVRNLYWKSALSAEYRCYDAYFFLKHAALRCTREDFESAFILHRVAMTHLLKKIMSDTDKMCKYMEDDSHEIILETEAMPLFVRKYYRSKKKVCKVKPIVAHYLYRNRSLINKPIRLTNAKLKQFIIKVASENRLNRYPYRKFSPQEIADYLVIDKWHDRIDIQLYNLENLISDMDNLMLREDVSRILKRARQQHTMYSHNLVTSYENSLDHSNAPELTKQRLDNFFRSVYSPMTRVGIDHGEIEDWVDERDLPLLIDEIERKDRFEKTNKENHEVPIAVEETFDKMVEFVLSQDFPPETSLVNTPLDLEKYVLGRKYVESSPFIKRVPMKNDSAEIFKEKLKQFLKQDEESKTIDINDLLESSSTQS